MSSLQIVSNPFDISAYSGSDLTGMIRWRIDTDDAIHVSHLWTRSDLASPDTFPRMLMRFRSEHAPARIRYSSAIDNAEMARFGAAIGAVEVAKTFEADCSLPGRAMMNQAPGEENTMVDQSENALIQKLNNAQRDEYYADVKKEETDNGTLNNNPQYPKTLALLKSGYYKNLAVRAQA